MKHEIDKQTGYLKITCTPEEQKELRRRREESFGASCGRGSGRFHFGSDQHEADALEHLIANSELDWLPEGATGDLTGAPMLGITDSGPKSGYLHGQLPEARFGHIQVGAWGRPVQPRYAAIVARWAYMRYAARSFLDDLADTGECIWEGGSVEVTVCDACDGKGYVIMNEEAELQRCDSCDKYAGDLEAAVAFFADPNREYDLAAIQLVPRIIVKAAGANP